LSHVAVPVVSFLARPGAEPEPVAAVLLRGGPARRRGGRRGRPKPSFCPCPGWPLPLLPLDGLDIEEGSRLQGLKQVAIAGVALYVVTEAEGNASAGAALHGGMATANTSLR
jgi:hypothetical protein